MTDTTVMEQQHENETAPVGAPSQLPDDRWLDDALKEFDDKTGQAEPPAGETDTNIPAESVSTDELDKLLADLSAPSADQQRIGQLTDELDGLKAQMRLAEETKAFNEFSDDLTKRVAEVNPHVEDDWVRLKLESFAHDPVARLAWETRGIPPADASRDLAYVQHALTQTTDPKQIAELNKLAYQLNIAAQSPAILRQIRNQIMSDAKKKLPPIDEIATADHDAVAFAARENISGTIPEPPVNWGRLSGKEFREKVIRDPRL